MSENAKRKNFIFNALGRDYINICLLDPKKKTAMVLKAFDGQKVEELEIGIEVSYEMMCEESIKKYALKEDQERMMDAVSIDCVMKELSDKKEYTFTFAVVKKGEEQYCQMKYRKMDDVDYIFMGFRMVDGTQMDAEELRKERMFLDVLCRDYTTVYYFDIKKDVAEILKMAPGANAAEMFGIQTRIKVKYSEQIEKYCNAYVVEEDREEFSKVMAVENIEEQLKKNDRIIHRYRSNPNMVGNRYFEVQMVRVSEEEFDHTALIAFRHIDDIVTAEQRHQKELEDALQKEKASNEILQALGKIYYAIFEIDLVSDVYEEIASDDKVHHLTGKTGVASSEMVELCKSVVVPEYQERILQFFDVRTLAQRLKNEDTIAEEYLAQDGNWHTARFVAKRRDEEGNVTNILYVTRLISDEKRREQNWIAIAQEANKANEAKTDFLRRMSHDIRTPINGILGMLEMENRHRTDMEKLQECRNKIFGAAEYLLSIVNNVLDIGKLESGEICLEHKPFDLIPLLVQQMSVVEIQASENGINYRGGKEMSTIRHRYLIGSPVHLNRLLMNLASNAIKYNHRGGTVTIYCTEISSDENEVIYEFICSDTGIGMSKEFQEHAFEPFTQEGKQTNVTYNGSGLGLSIVKEIVEQMNGKIELKSEEGRGTTFVVTIPFEIDHIAEKRASGEEEIPVAVDVTGRKALLVEDNELNREIAQMVLEDEGLIVTCAENGKKVVEQFEASALYTYDFIFMDIMMPVMDGLEATRRIRAMQRPDAKTVPILAMTANAFQDDMKQSMEAGMDAHLMKPINIDKMKQAIQEAARKNRDEWR